MFRGLNAENRQGDQLQDTSALLVLQAAFVGCMHQTANADIAVLRRQLRAQLHKTIRKEISGTAAGGPGASRPASRNGSKRRCSF